MGGQKFNSLITKLKFKLPLFERKSSRIVFSLACSRMSTHKEIIKTKLVLEISCPLGKAIHFMSLLLMISISNFILFRSEIWKIK